MQALNDLFSVETPDPLPPPEDRPYPPGPAAHLAVITWDVSADGAIPVARSHAELATGGLAVLLESRLQQDATILTTLTMSSFAGLASALLPWLLVGGTLALHHPFDPDLEAMLLPQVGDVVAAVDRAVSAVRGKSPAPAP